MKGRSSAPGVCPFDLRPPSTFLDERQSLECGGRCRRPFNVFKAHYTRRRPQIILHVPRRTRSRRLLRHGYLAWRILDREKCWPAAPRCTVREWRCDPTLRGSRTLTIVPAELDVWARQPPIWRWRANTSMKRDPMPLPPNDRAHTDTVIGNPTAVRSALIPERPPNYPRSQDSDVGPTGGAKATIGPRRRGWARLSRNRPCSYVDRIKLSFAGLTMRGNLGMSATAFGLATGMFY